MLRTGSISPLFDGLLFAMAEAAAINEKALLEVCLQPFQRLRLGGEDPGVFGDPHHGKDLGEVR